MSGVGQGSGGVIPGGVRGRSWKGRGMGIVKVWEEEGEEFVVGRGELLRGKAYFTGNGDRHISF